MKRLKHMKLRGKTFFTTFLLMIIVLIIAFSMIYLLIPSFYTSYKEDELSKNIENILPKLENQHLDDIKETLSLLTNQYSYGVKLTDKEEHTLFSVGLGLTIQHIDTDFKSSNDAIIVDEEYFSQKKSFKDSKGSLLYLEITASIQPVSDASSVILTILPYALFICILISALIAFLYSKALTKPIEAISNTTFKMKELDPNAQCEVYSHDEIGMLAENVNELYNQLLNTIENLQAEMNHVMESEQTKFNLLRTASHELKTPVSAVTGMVEGMIYGVGDFKNRDKYLGECKESLYQLSDLIKQILDMSGLDLNTLVKEKQAVNMQEFIQSIIHPYETIALSQNINLSLNIKNSFTTILPEKLLSQAISNILSNAIKYTPTYGSVYVYFENHTLIIENECNPLKEEILQHLFEPFYKSKDNVDSSSNGLGLYLTDRILKECNIQYDFSPYDKGMRFSIFL